MSASFLVIDKPEGLTSHDVVGICRAVTGEPKVGHTGTLDPFATGVLALAFGAGTRLIPYLDESVKIYDATITLGVETDTGDYTGEQVAAAPVPVLDAQIVRAALDAHLGEQLQRPPAYSAVKVQGKALYRYAREGVEVEVEPRPIHVESIDLLAFGPTELQVRIHCSRGTYARVLASDIARTLGTVGHLRALRRARSGPFEIADALSLDALAEIVIGQDVGWRAAFRPGEAAAAGAARGKDRDAQRARWAPRDQVRAGLAPWMRAPVDALSHLPILDVSAAEAARLRHGHMPSRLPPGRAAGAYLVVSGAEVLAVGEVTPRGAKAGCVLAAGAP